MEYHYVNVLMHVRLHSNLAEYVSEMLEFDFK